MWEEAGESLPSSTSKPSTALVYGEAGASSANQQSPHPRFYQSRVGSGGVAQSHIRRSTWFRLVARAQGTGGLIADQFRRRSTSKTSRKSEKKHRSPVEIPHGQLRIQMFRRVRALDTTPPCIKGLADPGRKPALAGRRSTSIKLAKAPHQFKLYPQGEVVWAVEQTCSEV